MQEPQRRSPLVDDIFPHFVAHLMIHTFPTPWGMSAESEGGSLISRSNCLRDSDPMSEWSYWRYQNSES